MEYEDLLKAKKQQSNSVNTIPPHTNNISTEVYNTSPVEDSVINRLYEGAANFSNEYSHLEIEKNKYAKYNVKVNSINTEKELQRERANNQSVLEQGLNMVVQAVASEAVIGTIKGFSDIADLLINAFNSGTNDYTNPISKELESWQEAIRDRFAIYEKDPDKTFNFLDTGWIFNGLVSTASTVTMAIPTMGVVKGVAAIGKIPKFGKAIKGIRSAAIKNVANTYKTISNSKLSTGRIVNTIERGSSIATNAAVSRTIENYTEARKVFKEVYDEKLEEINSLTKEQKDELIANNPQFEGMSNEEIAKYIAGESADKTFKLDYYALLFDVLQFNGISSLWKPKTFNRSTAALRIENINSMRQAAIDAGEENAKKLLATTGIKGWANRQLYKFNSPKSALSTLSSIPFTEGLEEMLQGYNTEAGKTKAEEIMHPYTFTPLSLSSYLSDPESWEQGFWGVVGGKGFEKVSTYVGNSYKMLKSKLNKEEISKQDYALGLTADEKIRASEIRNRSNVFKQYKANMDRLNAVNGEVPKGTRTLRDDNGNIIYEKRTIKRDNGEEITIDVPKEEEYELSENEIEEEKIKATNDFLADMVMNACDAGNYRLLMEYLKDPIVRKSISESNPEYSAMFNDILTKQMDKVRSNYEDNVYSIGNAIDEDEDVSYSAITKLSRNITRSQLEIESIDKKLEALEDDIYRLKLSDEDKNDIDNKLIEELDNELNQLQNYKKEIENSTANDTNKENNTPFRYSKQGSEAELYYVDLAIKKLEELRSETNNDLDHYVSNIIEPEIKSELEKTKIETGSIDSKELNEVKINETKNINNKQINLPKPVLKKLELLKRKAYLQTYIPNGIEQQRHLLQEMQEQEDMFYGVKIANAAKQVEDWAIKQENLVKAYKDIVNNDVPNELKESLDILRWGYSGTKEWVDSIINSLIEEQTKRDRIKEESSKIKVNGEERDKTEKDYNPIKEEQEKQKEQNSTAENQKKQDVVVKEQTNTHFPTGEVNQSDDSKIAETFKEEQKTDNVTDEIKAVTDLTKDNDDNITKIEEQAVKTIAINENEKRLILNVIRKYFHSKLTSEDIDKIIDNNNTINDLINEYKEKIIAAYNNKEFTIANTNNFNLDFIEEAILDDIRTFKSILKYGKINDIDQQRKLINSIILKHRFSATSDIYKNKNYLSEYLNKDNNELIDELIESYLNDIYNNEIPNQLHTINIDDLVLYLYNKYCANDNIISTDNLSELFNIIYTQRTLGNYNSKNEIKYNITFNNAIFNKDVTKDSFAMAIADLKASRKANDTNMRFSPAGRNRSRFESNIEENIIKNLLNSGKLKFGTKLNIRVADNGYIEILYKNNIIGTLNVPNKELDDKNNTVTYRPRIGKNAVLIHGVTSTSSVYNNGNTTLLYGAFRLISDPVFQAIYDNIDLFNIVYEYRTSKDKKSFDINKADDFIDKLRKALMVKGATKYYNNNDELDEELTYKYALNKFFKDSDTLSSKKILDSIAYIAIYDTSVDSSDIEYHRSIYYNYCKKEFFNYQKTYELANDLSKKYTIKFNSATIKEKDTGSIKQGVEISDTERDIKELNLTGKNNPVIMFESNGNSTEATVENNSIDLSDKILPPLDDGSMGLFLGLKNNSAMIATLTTPNSLSDTMQNNIKEELINIISKALNSNNSDPNKAIEQAYISLSYLFNSKDVHAPSIFGNIFNMSSTYSTTGDKYIVLKVNNDNNATLNFYIKDGELRLKVKDESENDIYINNINDKALSKVLDYIVKGITYNKSFVMKRDSDSYKNNPYYKKGEKGTFTITLNGKTTIYDNFADFIIKENAFKTNAIVNNTIEDNETISSMYMELIENKTKSKSKNKQENKLKEYDFTKEKKIDTIINELDKVISKNGKRKNNEPIETIDILKAIGLDNQQDILNIINGKDTSIIPSQVYYDQSLGTHQAQYERKDGQKEGTITLVKYLNNINNKIKKKGTIDSKKSYIQQEMVRLLVHESIHKKISELEPTQRDNILTEIADVYKETIRLLNNPKNKNNKEFKKILNWINNNDKVFADLNKDTVTSETLDAAEEFLVESITRPELYNVLNLLETESGETYKVEKKSILNKIIDILFKIFNKLIGKDTTVDINDKSILAKEYKILSDDITTINNIIKEKTNNYEEENNNKTEDDVLDNSPFISNETEEKIEENILTENLDFSTTTDIEETISEYINKLQPIQITSMDNFIKQFPIEHQNDIKKMLDNNEIVYYCK